MTDKEIVDRAKDAEKRTGFGELVHSSISKGVNSAYGIGFIEGMVEYRNFLQESVSEDLDNHTIMEEIRKCGCNPNEFDVARHFFELGLKAQKGE